MSQQISLVDVGENGIVVVSSINAGYKAQRFLADLGIHEEEKIRVVKNDTGPIIVEVKGTRVAIGRGLAKKIEVS
jgi:ferrous iron transport protein A